MFFGRNDAKAETPVLWPPHVKSWLIGKDSDAGRDWGQEAKGTTEDEMAGWHHWLDGCESEWTPGVGDGQGGLVCFDSWGRKESDTTERLNWTEFNLYINNKTEIHVCSYYKWFYADIIATNVMLVIHKLRDAHNVNKVDNWLSYHSKGWSRELSQTVSLQQILKQKLKLVHHEQMSCLLLKGHF